MARLKIGDLVEIRTSLGNVYAQYTHNHPNYGELLRVFDGEYVEAPAAFDGVIKSEVRFSFFFPLKAAVRQGLVEIVGNFPVDNELLRFPLFRTGLVESSGKVGTWWIWNGEQSEKIGKLSEEQRHISIRGIWNYDMLITRLESRWTPFADPTTT